MSARLPVFRTILVALLLIAIPTAFYGAWGMASYLAPFGAAHNAPLYSAAIVVVVASYIFCRTVDHLRSRKRRRGMTE